MKKPNKVYIVKAQRSFDFSQAERYGELVFVDAGTVNVRAPQRAIDLLKDKLKDFTANDYLLLSGNTIANGYALLIVARKVKVLKMLLFDASKDDYYSHRLDTVIMETL